MATLERKYDKKNNGVSTTNKKLIIILVCIITVVDFCVFDVIRWKRIMAHNDYLENSNEICFTSSHWPLSTSWPSDSYVLPKFFGTLEPDEADEYLITTEVNYITIKFITHTSGDPVKFMIIRDDGCYKTFTSNTRDIFSFSDGYNIELERKGTYKLIVSSPYHVDYVVEFDGYIKIVEED